MKNGYSIVIRHYPKGVWQSRINRSTARDCKRALASVLGIAQSKTERIKIGKNMLTLPNGFYQVKLEPSK